MDSTSARAKTRIKKRKYSRKGCQECKRRKIKCDEALPECHNCTRLNKRCSYDQGAMPSQTTPTSTLPNPTTYDMDLRLKFYEPRTDEKVEPKWADPAPRTPQNGTKPWTRKVTTDEKTLPKTEILDLIPPDGDISPHLLSTIDMQALLDEASVLVSDIHHNQAILGEAEVGRGRYAAGFVSAVHYAPDTASNVSLDDPKLNLDEFLARIHQDTCVSPSGVSEQLRRLALELIDQCIAENELDSVHVTYLRTLSTTDFSFHVYPFASLIESNEVVKLLLTYAAKCPYLLTSLLAISATFQFNQTGKSKHDAARQNYILVCISKLSDAFAEHLGFKDEALFASNIEKLLLTVLVLTSCFTATTSLLDDLLLLLWQAHHRGARDLLVNYSRVTKERASQSLYMSGGLALAKCWFFAIESVAAIHSITGKTASTALKEVLVVNPTDKFLHMPELPVTTESLVYMETAIHDFAVNPSYHDALRRVNLIVPSPTSSDFNMFWGVTSRFVRCLPHYNQVMAAMRDRGYSTVPVLWMLHLFSLTDEASRERVIPGTLLANYEVPILSRGHPDYEPQMDRLIFPSAAFVRDEGRVLSWFDITHQFHCLHLTLKLLVLPFFLALPRTHPQVQELALKMLDGAVFIKKKPVPPDQVSAVVCESDHYYLSRPTFDNRCIMIQSIFRLVMGVVADEDGFERVELFFMGLVKLGNGSSLGSLDVVARFREQRRARRDKGVDDEVFEYSDKRDDIPFC